MKYLLIFCGLIGYLNLHPQHRQRIIDEKYSSNQVKKISISSDETNYIINGHSDTSIVVSITAITNSPKKMDELKKNYKIVSQIENGTLRIETFAGDAKGSFLVEIRLPASIPLDISTQSSHVMIQNTQNDIHLTHHSQPIELKDVRGGKININSKNGEVTIKNSAGDFQVNTNKTIDAEILDGQLTCISGGHQNILLGKPIPTMCNTQNGNIKIKVPSNAPFDCRMVADTPIKLDLNNIVFEGSINPKSITGKIHQGSIPLKLVANKGGIWLSN
jgi:DUF4097 and DUF4098 domain-containing protein YvlB